MTELFLRRPFYDSMYLDGNLDYNTLDKDFQTYMIVQESFKMDFNHTPLDYNSQPSSTLSGLLSESNDNISKPQKANNSPTDDAEISSDILTSAEGMNKPTTKAFHNSSSAASKRRTRNFINFTCSVPAPDKELMLEPCYIVQPHDVICSQRGCKDSSVEHSGNERFRVIVEMNLERYCNANNRLAKSQIVREIVDSIRQSGGKFVRREEDGTFYDIGNIRAREKAGHAIRGALVRYSFKGGSMKAKCKQNFSHHTATKTTSENKIELEIFSQDSSAIEPMILDNPMEGDGIIQGGKNAAVSQIKANKVVSSIMSDHSNIPDIFDASDRIRGPQGSFPLQSEQMITQSERDPIDNNLYLPCNPNMNKTLNQQMSQLGGQLKNNNLGQVQHKIENKIKQKLQHTIQGSFSQQTQFRNFQQKKVLMHDIQTQQIQTESLRGERSQREQMKEQKINQGQYEQKQSKNSQRLESPTCQTHFQMTDQSNQEIYPHPISSNDIQRRVSNSGCRVTSESDSHDQMIRNELFHEVGQDFISATHFSPSTESDNQYICSSHTSVTGSVDDYTIHNAKVKGISESKTERLMQLRREVMKSLDVEKMMLMQLQSKIKSESEKLALQNSTASVASIDAPSLREVPRFLPNNNDFLIEMQQNHTQVDDIDLGKLEPILFDYSTTNANSHCNFPSVTDIANIETLHGRATLHNHNSTYNVDWNDSSIQDSVDQYLTSRNIKKNSARDNQTVDLFEGISLDEFTMPTFLSPTVTSACVDDVHLSIDYCGDSNPDVDKSIALHEGDYFSLGTDFKNIHTLDEQTNRSGSVENSNVQKLHSTQMFLSEYSDFLHEKFFDD